MIQISRTNIIADLQKQYDLLQMEYACEKEAFQEKNKEADIMKLVRQGNCRYPVQVGASRYNSLNQLVVELDDATEAEIEHNLEYGRPVCFFTVAADGSLRYANFQAVVSYVRHTQIVVSMPSQTALSELQRMGQCGLQLYFDNTSYKTMFDALKTVMAAKDNRTAELRDILLGGMPAENRTITPQHFSWLNQSQEEAVNKVLACKDVSIVHGPPGTGKTTTLVEAVYETLMRENQVLVCAQSNTAVDCISEKLVDRGINVLRIGNPTRVDDKMLSFTYERRFEAHPDYPTLWSMRKALREKAAHLRRGNESTRDFVYRLRSQITELEIKIDEQLFSEARVIACTLVGSANRVLSRKSFSTLFIDEAAQALEAACWISIEKSKRVVFAGDYCQLPPIIKCMEAARQGLDVTLMAKVAKYHPEAVSVLNVQYRMHEDIMRFSSDWFYHGALEAAPEVKYRGILEYDTPIVWIDTAGCDYTEANTDIGFGRINKEEAELLVAQLKYYIEKIGVERIFEEHIDIGVISPYRAQVQYLRHLIRRDSLFTKSLRRQIAVHTVDGFQGQERDVILISLVRANADGNIGFLNDLRRMNVAITRARMKLIILGDASTLTHHRFYKALYEYIEVHGAVVPLSIE